MTSIRGEYWIDTSGTALFADGDVGDFHHEALVLHHAMYEVVSELGFSFDDDAPDQESFFRLVDEFNRDESEHYETSDAFRDPEGTMVDHLKRQGKWTPELGELIDCALDRLERPLYAKEDTPEDVREFAIVRWGWCWVKKNWIGIHIFDEATRKRLVSGIDEILDQEGIYSDDDEAKVRWEIRIYKSNRLMYGTRDQIRHRFCEKAPLPFSLDALNAVAKEQVRQMDLAIELPCYHNKPA